MCVLVNGYTRQGMFIIMLGFLTVFTQSCVYSCHHIEHMFTLKKSSRSFYGQMKVRMNDCIVWSRPHLVEQFARKTHRTHWLLLYSQTGLLSGGYKLESAKGRGTGGGSWTQSFPHPQDVLPPLALMCNNTECTANLKSSCKLCTQSCYWAS